MRRSRIFIASVLIPVLILMASASWHLRADASSGHSELGSIHFPTTGSVEAQRHFLRGVAALHSFWYEEALAAFRESTTADPDFAMGYWGEAMTHTRPIWREQDLAAGRVALGKVRQTDGVTAKERAFIDAVKLLYGEGDKSERDERYSAAMEKIYRNDPDDLEAACFYALSLLGLSRGSDEAYRLQVRAGAIALDVFGVNPNHPGAAHYTIHAFDHPDLAILALSAAQKYAKIAPESAHAQHMPAHIFVQLGMWSEAAASNEAGWRDSTAWVKREGLPAGMRDYHSLHWLMYTYLQQGRYKEARQLLTTKREHMREAGDDPHAESTGYERRVARYYGRMAAAFVAETQEWNEAAMLDAPPGLGIDASSQATLAFAKAYAAAARGGADAKTQLEALQRLKQDRLAEDPFFNVKRLDIWELEVKAEGHRHAGRYEDAIKLMREAVALEEELPPPSGPPRMIKPTHELLGEILLQAGKPTQALAQFSTSLARHPNRPHSLLGAARAAAQSGNQEHAARYYSGLLAAWKNAEPGLPGLREASEYMKQRTAS